MSQDLAALAGVLDGTAVGGDLEGLDWARLAERLDRLHADAGALAALPERTALLRDLAKRGLGDLLADLAARRVAAGVVGAELDLAWWSTAFEEILRQDPAMAAHDGGSLSRLVAEFRTLDRRHLSDRALLHVAGSRESLRQRLHRCDEQTQALFGEIVEDRFTSLRQAVDRYPDVTRHLRPCLVVGPMLVPHVLPPTRTEDLLILDAAGHLPTELVVGALARARQVVVVADTRCATGSAVHALAEVLPTVTLSSDAVPRHPRLTAFLAEHGYGGALTATPLPATAGLLRLDLVDGTGMPGRDGAVTSTAAEVDHVVASVVEHAVTRPTESLAVVALTTEHADRVREAVLAEVRADPALGGFFAPEAREPFVVVDLAATEALRRDAVLLTVGFGRTPHGRVLHRFGRLGEPGGEHRLLEALGAARRRLVVVSSFAGSDLDPERLTSPGPVLLRDLLTMVGEPDGAAGEPAAPDGSDRLVLDLAERLWRLGLIVAVEHGTPGGPAVPLAVGHPDLPEELLVAVLTDDDAYLGEPSVRVRDRQVAERLERLGWSVVQVWSAAAFGDPQAEADAIAQVVVEAYAARAARPAAAAPRRAEGGAGKPSPARGTSAPEPAGEDAAPAADDAADLPAPDGAGRDATEEVAPEGGTPEQGVLEVPEVEVSEPRPLRPDVSAGLPVGAYTDDQLDDLAAWLLTGDVEREESRLAAALRAELGFKRRGSRIDAVVGAAARRALGGR